MFARFTEYHVRITFLSNIQIHHGRRDIGEVITAIKRQVHFVFTLELIKLLRVTALYPAGGRR